MNFWHFITGREPDTTGHLPPLKKLAQREGQSFRQLSKTPAPSRTGQSFRQLSQFDDYTRKRYLVHIDGRRAYIVNRADHIEHLKSQYGSHFGQIARPVLRDRLGYYMRGFLSEYRFDTQDALMEVWENRERARGRYRF